MYSKKKKMHKFFVDIIVLFLTTVASGITTSLAKTTSFWSYSFFIYSIPILINIIYFVLIFNNHESKQDFTYTFKKKYLKDYKDKYDTQYETHLNQACAQRYKNQSICIIIMYGLLCILLVYLFVLVFLSLNFTSTVKQPNNKIILYITYYSLFAISSCVEKGFNFILSKEEPK